jgi:hypothetical protein
VARECLEHVVEEPDTGAHGGGTGTVEIDPHPELGFVRAPRDIAYSRHRPLLLTAHR